jgi:hypothetical protein
LFKILKDFPELFVIIYHGNCLRLYFSKKYETEMRKWSEWDSHKSSSQRLNQPGGIYGDSLDTEKSEKLSNNYCYFDLDTKKLNIKFVYKLLSILFENSNIPIKYKTVITITGKYSERGYSFTSDDYSKFLFHLTDQYFVSHSLLFNCTMASQMMRIQGKMSNPELLNGNMKLTLWTTPLLHDVMQNFYVRFIKLIEKDIMSCENWQDIKDLVERIIDNGEIKLKNYMKYLDVKRRMSNLILHKHYDKKHNGYCLFNTDDMSDSEIIELCKENKLPEYKIVNEIKQMNKCDFIKKYGKEWSITTVYDLNLVDLNLESNEITINNIIAIDTF